MATVMSLETDGTFDPAKENPTSHATGLIQFMPETARGLGTTIEALARMSDMDQLDWVEKYFRQNGFAGRMHNLNDTYLAVFYPSAMGHPSDYVVAREGSKVYSQNPGFDQPDSEGNRKGYFTVGDITRVVHGVYNAGAARGRLETPQADPSSSSSTDVIVLGLVGVTWLLWRYYG